MMTDTMTVNPIEAMAALATHLGVRDIKDSPGCWEVQVDDHWWFVVNAHLDLMLCSRGMTVEPGHVVFEFDGWPAGNLTILGDGWFAAGDAANPEAFAAAVRARIAGDSEVSS